MPQNPAPAPQTPPAKNPPAGGPPRNMPPQPAQPKSATSGEVVLPPPSRIQQAPPRPVAPTGSVLTGKPAPQAPQVNQAMPPAQGTQVRQASNMPAPAAAATTTQSPRPAGTPPMTPTPPASPAASTNKSPKIAAVRQSPFRFLPFIIGGLLIVGLIYFLFTRFFGAKPTTSTTPTSTNKTTRTQTTITYWGLWEPSTVMQEVIADFEKENPGIKVNYQQQSYKDYRERLQNAIATDKGPDVFRFHATWAPMFRQQLDPLPSSVYSPTDYEQTFYPVAVRQLTLDDKLVGVPIMYDGLALYYNEEIFRTANVQPPKTWSEVKALAPKLTVRTGNKIERGGIALGNASNVEHFSDIIGLLMLQNGGDPRKPTSKEVQEAMIFYTDFVKKDRVWDSTLPDSTVAFARGDVAMMIAPSWRVHEIQALNPNLKFGIASVPQLTNERITWASYWAEGVNTRSKNKTAAWAFVKYLSSPTVMKKFYSDAKKVRAFGEIYSRKDLAGELASDPYVSAYLSDAPYAKGWYMSSFTHDNGINDLMIKYYQDAVNAIISGKDIESTMTTVEQGTGQTLRQYGFNVSIGQPTTTTAQ